MTFFSERHIQAPEGFLDGRPGRPGNKRNMVQEIGRAWCSA